MTTHGSDRGRCRGGRHVVLAAALCIVTAAGIHAQAPTAGGEVPPAMQKAAGMALRDGALAPGMLTVRVVRGSFDRNAANETVRLDVGGRIERAVTGPDGRAQFAHLPIGSSVQATAVVDGQALASERFDMAADSGIRVLLIAGEGNATASGIPSGAAPVTNEMPAPVASAPPAGTAAAEDSTVVGIRVAFAMATAVALALVVFGKYGWRPGRFSRRPDA